MSLPKHFGTVLDRQGNVVPSASVLVKLAGTSTPAVLYQDDEVTVIPNPLTTTALGEYSFKTDDGEYDIVTSLSGVTDTAVKVRLYPIASVAGKALLTALDAAAQRTALGLGTAALQPVTAFLVGANNLSEIVSQSASRTNLGLVAVASSGSAADLTTGTLADARLSANVPLLNAAVNNFNGKISISGASFITGEQLRVGGYSIFGSSSQFVLGDSGSDCMFGSFSNSPLVIRLNNTEKFRIISSGEFGFGVTPTAGNGLLQFASGTTRANGIAFGTDQFIHRASAYSTTISQAANVNGAFTSFYDNTNSVFRGYIGYGVNLFTGGAITDFGLMCTGSMKFAINSITALTIDTSQNATFAGNVVISGRSVIGTTLSLQNAAINNDLICSNSYFNGTFVALQTGAASVFQQADGNMYWHTAASVTAGATQSLVQRMMLDGSGNLAIGGQVSTAGNGLLQLASGTTKANGIAFGTDTFLQRFFAGGAGLSSNSGTDAYWYVSRPDTGAVRLRASDTAGYVQTNSALPLILGSDGVAITINTSQNCTFSGKVGIGVGASTRSIDIGNGTLTGFINANGSTAFDCGSVTNHATRIFSNSTVALTIDTSQNATFAGYVQTPQLNINEVGKAAGILWGSTQLYVGPSSNHGVILQTNDTPALTIDTSQNATFAGQAFISGPSYSGHSTGRVEIAAGEVICDSLKNYGTAYFFNNIQTFSGQIHASAGVSLQLITTGTAALTIDTAQGVSSSAARYLKVRSVVSAAGTTALDASDHVVVLTGSTTQTFTLPSASNGRVLVLKNRSSGTLTINRAGANTIDGGTTTTITAGAFKQLVANGSDWCVAG